MANNQTPRNYVKDESIEFPSFNCRLSRERARRTRVSLCTCTYSCTRSTNVHRSTSVWCTVVHICPCTDGWVRRVSNVRVRLSMCHCLGIKSNRLLPKLNNNTLNKMLISVKCDRQNKHIRPNGKLRWFLRSPSPSLTLCHSTFFYISIASIFYAPLFLFLLSM